MEETLLESLPFQVPALFEACNALIMSEISLENLSENGQELETLFVEAADRQNRAERRE